MGGIPCWSGEQCEEEKGTETKCYQLTVTPILHPLASLGTGQVVEELGVKLSLGVERKWVLSCSSLFFGERGNVAWYSFHHPTLFLIVNELN